MSNKKGKDVVTSSKDDETSTRLAKLIDEVELMKMG